MTEKSKSYLRLLSHSTPPPSTSSHSRDLACVLDNYDPQLDWFERFLEEQQSTFLGASTRAFPETDKRDRTATEGEGPMLNLSGTIQEAVSAWTNNGKRQTRGVCANSTLLERIHQLQQLPPVDSQSSPLLPFSTDPPGQLSGKFQTSRPSFKSYTEIASVVPMF